MRSLTTSPGKAGLRVQSGDTHTRDDGAACRGPPVVRERDNLDNPSHRIPGPIGTEKMNSGESDVQKTSVN
jgi:hypothetical protein